MFYTEITVLFVFNNFYKIVFAFCFPKRVLIVVNEKIINTNIYRYQLNLHNYVHLQIRYFFFIFLFLMVSIRYNSIIYTQIDFCSKNQAGPIFGTKNHNNFNFISISIKKPKTKRNHRKWELNKINNLRNKVIVSPNFKNKKNRLIQLKNKEQKHLNNYYSWK